MVEVMQVGIQVLTNMHISKTSHLMDSALKRSHQSEIGALIPHAMLVKLAPMI